VRINTIGELKNKEVINLCDGKRMGFVCDVEIDLDTGCVVAILVPPEGKLFTLGRCAPDRILWCDIERIGDDVILVRTRPRIECEGKC